MQFGSAVGLQIHSGILVERRLHNVDLDAFGPVYHLRQERHLFGMDGAELGVFVDIFERRFKCAPGKSGPGVPVLCKVEFGGLALYLEGLLALGYKAICNTVVVGAEHYVTVLVAEGQLVEVVDDLCALVGDRSELVVDATAGKFLHLARAINVSIGELHLNLRVLQQAVTVVENGVGQVFAGGDVGHDMAVGRHHLNLFVGCRSGHSAKQYKGCHNEQLKSLFHLSIRLYCLLLWWCRPGGA